MITNKNILIGLISFVISLYIHEVGHMIALWMLGISSYIELGVTSNGLVLTTKWAHAPTEQFDIYFAAFFGPFFSGVVFMIIGKIRSEAYLAGVFQLLYAPFEVMIWVLFENTGALSICILIFIMVVIPGIRAFEWGLSKIEECNK